jgi:hypothetical protein
MILMAFAGIAGAIGLGLMRISQRISTPQQVEPIAVDPIIGPRDRIAMDDSGEVFIPMPLDLKTKDEMVAWMTTELPRLTAEIQNPRP